jgi:hypothetical protein
MDSKVALLYSQEPTTGTYREQVNAATHQHYILILSRVGMTIDAGMDWRIDLLGTYRS